MTREFADRFWEKVAVKSDDECWLWTAHTNGVGYGMIQKFVDGSWTKVLAHRSAYELSVGPIPPKALVCHQCDNPSCVNPSHLFIGSHSDNTQDMIKKDRHRYIVLRGADHPQVKDPSKVLRGERNGQSKLNATQVTEIRKKLSQGKAVRALAREYGISRRAISHVRDRRNWKHLA